MSTRIDMADFGIRFFFCNILIGAIICILLITKQLLRHHLTSRMQFNVWFLLLGLLAVPFIPVHPVSFSQILLLLDKWRQAATSDMETVAETAVNVNSSATTRQLHDYVLSVSSKTPPVIGLILSGIWLIGIFVMLLFVLKSKIRLNTLQKSALPLQSTEVRAIYNHCLNELKIKRNIPIYSTAFLKSPMIVGLFRPCIYLPIHLISDFLINAQMHQGTPEGYCNAADMRYILLHELQHYKHKDAIAGYLMNFFGILYWPNPLVWYALKEMRGDREAACDTSVLKFLNENEYEDYGNTLINFAEKISLSPFPFSVGISGNMRQMQKRIINISSYEKPSILKRIKGFTAFGIIAVLLPGLAPMLSTYAVDQSYYQWDISSEKIDLVDLSAYFSGYEGSFVLYDLKADRWSVYDMDYATFRTAPDSTYKIYDALFGLEEGIITPNDSHMVWNGTDYPFEAWNADQDLSSAMESSVNWYFQKIDEQLGAPALRNYVKEIGYGNKTINADLSSYWMHSASNAATLHKSAYCLKISPVEQVLLLIDLYSNDFGFTPENVDTVKDSICLFSSEGISFYGKTGTGRIDDQDISGWFIGFACTAENTYFFATNIQSNSNATGSSAAEITKSVLSELNIM